MLERLNFKTIRFDSLADSVLIDGKKATVEISREAFEALYRRSLTGDEVIVKAIEEAKRLNHLVNIIPADDGKINITAALMLGEGQFSELPGKTSGDQ